MTTNRSTAERPARRDLEPRSWPRPPGLALFGLALFGLIQAGCHADGCSNCGLGNSISNGFQAIGRGVETGAKAVGSIFHHKKGCGGGSDCGCGDGGGGYEEGVVVDQGIPVVPGAMAIPAPGTIVAPPSLESEPTNLKPLDNSSASPTSGNTTTKPTTSRSTPSGTNRSGYTTSVPKGGAVAGRSSETDQSLSRSSSRTADLGGAAALLESIPPVDLPSEVTRKAVSTPSPAPVANPAPANAAPNSAEHNSAAEGGTLTLPPIVAAASFQAPGLRRFASIAPAVAGGSAPSVEGLDWLKEKGYRTLLDLRKSSEVEPDFVDAVNDRGMVYISLPIMANRLDPSRLARFDDLISRTENRPLFFCDADGSRAALAWYIHERVVGHENSQSALSKAEELGLGAAEVKLAEDYLASMKPKAKAAMARVAMSTSTPATEPAPAPPATPSPDPLPTPHETTPPALPEIPDGATQPTSTHAAPARFEEATPSMLPGEDRPQAKNVPASDYRDPGAWKPVAALVLTGLGVPLAFWSRSMLSEYRHVRKRASLTGSKRRSLEAPAGSDA